MTRVLIVSGGADYTDPWHPFAETTARLADILGTAYDTTVTTEVAATLSALRGGEWDLVVLNLGSAGQPLATDDDAVAGLTRHARAGGPLLVAHVSATAFPHTPEWEQLLGGRWVRGTSMHPPQGRAEIVVSDTGHPITRDVGDFVLDDERYSYLRISDAVDVLATHEHDGQQHPLIWARDGDGYRVVYVGLGHDAGAYDSDEHRTLVSRAAAWLLDPASAEDGDGR